MAWPEIHVESDQITLTLPGVIASGWERSEPVEYVLYTHYGHSEEADFRAWSSQHHPHRDGGRPASDAPDPITDQLQGVCFLKAHLDRLEELLAAPAHRGMLMMFYKSGFPEFLKGVAKGRTERELRNGEPRLQFGCHVQAAVNRLLRSRGLESRVRFLTPLDLHEVFSRMNWNQAKQLYTWFLGQQGGTYDTPKIIEAVVRLRLLGSGVPVFRVDYDVLFRGEASSANPSGNQDVPDLGLFKAVGSCIHAYERRVKEAGIDTFVFSAAYDEMKVRNDSDDRTTLADWVGAFATRIFPALVVRREPAEIARATGNWPEYGARKDVFSHELVRRFLGLSRYRQDPAGAEGIGRLGAPPTSGVISGALLCQSDAAILDLPPFSNFTLNVLWIDDHLKYCLHRELRQFTLIEPDGGALLHHAKLDAITVEKRREPIKDLPAYVLGVYLPRLLWGCVVDGWITQHPLIKFRRESLAGDVARARWDRLARTGPSQGVLVKFLLAALESGDFSTESRNALRCQLTQAGLKRIEAARQEWRRLTASEDGAPTFASLWATHTVSDYFEDAYLNTYNQGRVTQISKGIGVPGLPERPIEELSDLNPALREQFEVLVEDAMEYVSWTLVWPRIVQVVRSVERGTVKTDIRLQNSLQGPQARGGNSEETVLTITETVVSVD